MWHHLVLLLEHGQAGDNMQGFCRNYGTLSYLRRQIVNNTEASRALWNWPGVEVQSRCKMSQLDVEVLIKV